MRLWFLRFLWWDQNHLSAIQSSTQRPKSQSHLVHSLVTLIPPPLPPPPKSNSIHLNSWGPFGPSLYFNNHSFYFKLTTKRRDQHPPSHSHSFNPTPTPSTPPPLPNPHFFTITSLFHPHSFSLTPTPSPPLLHPHFLIPSPSPPLQSFSPPYSPLCRYYSLNPGCREGE